MSMSMINAVRSWGHDAALAAQRASESTAALGALRDHAGALDELTRATNGWTKAEDAWSLLIRAVNEHPGGAGLMVLRRAAEIAEQVSGDLGMWVATAGSRASFTSVEAVAISQLDDVRRLATEAATS